MDFEVGDRVRIDIPDTTDTNHQHHGKHGTITQVIPDQAEQITGKPEDSGLIRVKLETGEKHDFRPRDLRPPID